MTPRSTPTRRHLHIAARVELELMLFDHWYPLTNPGAFDAGDYWAVLDEENGTATITPVEEVPA